MDETACPCCYKPLKIFKTNGKTIKECDHCDAIVEYVSGKQREKDLKGTYEGKIVEE